MATRIWFMDGRGNTRIHNIVRFKIGKKDLHNQGVPRNPFGSYASDLLNVEKSMNLRRKRLHFVLSKSQIAPSVSTFPLLGVRLNNNTAAVRGAIANSEYVSDDLINPHPRFGALTQNIRQRRGSNVNISVAGIDEQTIHMDAMAFGMGCCCLQVRLLCLIKGNF